MFFQLYLLFLALTFLNVVLRYVLVTYCCLLDYLLHSSHLHIFDLCGIFQHVISNNAALLTVLHTHHTSEI